MYELILLLNNAMLSSVLSVLLTICLISPIIRIKMTTIDYGGPFDASFEKPYGTWLTSQICKVEPPENIW